MRRILNCTHDQQQQVTNEGISKRECDMLITQKSSSSVLIECAILFL